MANRKISDLTALTAPVTGDLLPIVDISEAAAADKNKKITLGTLLSGAPLGSAAAPSFAFTGDTNTGIYSPGADQLAVATNGNEAFRVTSGGYFKASNNGTYLNATGAYHELRQTANDTSVFFTSTNVSYAAIQMGLGVDRAASASYSFLSAYSDNSGAQDREFNLRGDGNGLCDGSWTGGGADYAEYFEWSDGNINAEDRRGISVVLDGEKIRESLPNEDPIGVISGNPSIVGDSAWNKWSGKYLRDEFGTYIQEVYSVTDNDGKIVIQQRRKLNPVYNPNNEYIPREQRPEWACVGLMGKLRIRKGQSIGARWIKMRDVSNFIEEWLVR